jgi:hypothetical protein
MPATVISVGFGTVIAIPSGIVIAIAGLSTISDITTTDAFGNDTLNTHAFRRLALGALIAFGIGILYRTIMEGSSRGQTVGKMAMGIAVKDLDDGGSIGYAARERIATPGDKTPIRPGMAFAWNPSAVGYKAEQTLYLDQDGTQHILTSTNAAS